MDKDNAIEQQEDTVSLGKKLATLRKKLALTENDIATRIYVPKTIIQDIENNKTINVPNVFLKGYIKAYAELVHLPKEEYLPYLDVKVSQLPIDGMRNYSHKQQNKRRGKRIFLLSLLSILIIIAITLFFVWRDDKSHLVEVNHYISPSVSTINS